jgi:hypothetical protein
MTDDIDAVLPPFDVDKRVLLLPRACALIDTPALSAMLAASSGDVREQSEFSLPQSLVGCVMCRCARVIDVDNSDAFGMLSRSRETNIE